MVATECKDGRHHLVGLVGPAGAGKDSVAELLVAQAGFTRVAFADRLKAFAEAIDPAMGIASRVLGAEVAKRRVTGYRERLIEIGETARNLISPEVWIDALDTQVQELLETRSVVVADVRRLNEADWLSDCGGALVAVRRTGLAPENEDMRQIMRVADFDLYNVGALDELAESTALLAAWLEEDE